MESGFSMQARAEITTRYAKAYGKAAKADKGRVLDEVVAVTGWSRDNARRLVAAARQCPPRPALCYPRDHNHGPFLVVGVAMTGSFDHGPFLVVGVAMTASARGR
ncbi:MAG: hypothetical protein ACT4PP_12940 [Sporichthyaceae bacterium]